MPLRTLETKDKKTPPAPQMGFDTDQFLGILGITLLHHNIGSSMLDKSTIKRSPLFRWGRRRAFAVKAIGCSKSPLLSLAIKYTSSNRLTRDERNIISDIEEIRASLEQNESEIVVHDYGAGSHKHRRDMDERIIESRKIGHICKGASKDFIWCMFLFQVIRQFKPAHCIEMGTCLGISAAYIASALKLNGFGHLITLDGSPEQAKIARATFQELGLKNVRLRVGKFQDTLLPTLNEMSPINFVFIDGHHDEDATCQYFDTIRKHLDVENVLIFDDINWSEGMKNAWRYVSSRSEAYNLGPLGACINVCANT